jgi:hypothetical protein
MPTPMLSANKLDAANAAMMTLAYALTLVLAAAPALALALQTLLTLLRLLIG